MAHPPPTPVLSPSQLARLRAVGDELTAEEGDVLYRIGDLRYPFIAILDGEVAIVDAAGREIVRHGASGFLGEMNLLNGQTVFLTAVVTKNFKAEGAELLHQPDLLVHFQNQLQEMPEFKTQTPLIDQIHGALIEVKPLIATPQKISPEAVRKINEITTRLDTAIVTKQ